MGLQMTSEVIQASLFHQTYLCISFVLFRVLFGTKLMILSGAYRIM